MKTHQIWAIASLRGTQAMRQIPVICPMIPISSTRCRRRGDALFNWRDVRNPSRRRLTGATRRRRFTAVTASYDPHLPVSANPMTPQVIQTNLSSESPRLLELNCLIISDDPSRIFAVKIEETKSVGYLKEAIKSKKKPAFNNVDANTLDLWSVSIDVNDHLEEKINDLNLKSMNPLSPVKKLSGVFSNQLEDKHLHIVVQPLSECQHVPN